jgi:hypothetical protein
MGSEPKQPSWELLRALKQERVNVIRIRNRLKSFDILFFGFPKYFSSPSILPHLAWDQHDTIYPKFCTTHHNAANLCRIGCSAPTLGLCIRCTCTSHDLQPQPDPDSRFYQRSQSRCLASRGPTNASSKIPLPSRAPKLVALMISPAYQGIWTPLLVRIYPRSA